MACGLLVAALTCLRMPANGPVVAWAGESEAGVADSGANYVHCEGNLLTARTSGMSLRDLLLEIGRQSGATIHLDGLTDRPTSDSFTRLPLDIALRRLMPEQNFTVVYATERGPEGNILGTRIKEVRVWPGGQTGTSQMQTKRASVARPAGRGDRGVEDEERRRPVVALSARWTRFFKRHARVALEPGSLLAAALDREQASLGQLAATAMHDQDADVRRQAAVAFADVLDSDPRAAELVGSGADGENDIDSLASGLRASGGPYAEEFLEVMGRHLKIPLLRLKANQILARYRRAR